jgi:hypothetical protein
VQNYDTSGLHSRHLKEVDDEEAEVEEAVRGEGQEQIGDDEHHQHVAHERKLVHSIHHHHPRLQLLRRALHDESVPMPPQPKLLCSTHPPITRFCLPPASDLCCARRWHLNGRIARQGNEEA